MTRGIKYNSLHKNISLWRLFIEFINAKIFKIIQSVGLVMYNYEIAYRNWNKQIYSLENDPCLFLHLSNMELHFQPKSILISACLKLFDYILNYSTKMLPWLLFALLIWFLLILLAELVKIYVDFVLFNNKVCCGEININLENWHSLCLRQWVYKYFMFIFTGKCCNWYFSVSFVR